MDLNRATLLLNVVNPNAALPYRSGPVKLSKRPRTYSADAKNTAGGAKNVTVDFYGTDAEAPSLASEADWVKIGAIAMVTDGAVRVAGGFVSDDTWNQVKAVISVADAQATLTINAYASSE